MATSDCFDVNEKCSWKEISPIPVKKFGAANRKNIHEMFYLPFISQVILGALENVTLFIIFLRDGQGWLICMILFM